MSTSTANVKRSHFEKPAGTRRFTGGTGQFLAFPPGIEALELDAKLAFLEGKKD